MLSDLMFDPPFAMKHILGLGVLLVLLAGASYVLAKRGVGRGRKAVLATVRILALAGLIVVLLKPMLAKPQPEKKEKPVFSILVDTSGSMNTADVSNKPRAQAVAEELRSARSSLMTELGKNYDVRVYEFSDRLLSTTLEQLASRQKVHGVKTDLTEALLGAVHSVPNQKKAGMLLISDGRDNAGGDVMRAASHLKSSKVPVWTASVGSATGTKDVYVTARMSQNFIFAKQPGSVKVNLSQTGYSGWYAKVDLHREDQYVTSQQVMLKDGTHEVEFPIKEDAKGIYQYRVSVEALPGEGDVRNNRRSVFARVVDQKTRVLFVEAKPYWDSKFLMRALREDPNIELTSFFQINSSKTFTVKEKTSPDTLSKVVATDPIQFPRAKEELYQYDCIIFGRSLETMLTADDLKLLKDYLTERGGSIVFSRGRSYTGENRELAGLEPVVWDNDTVKEIRFELTPEGKESPIFTFGHPKGTDLILRELPPMVSITKVQKEKSLSVILAKGVGKAQKEIAAISYQRYGKGKVMSLGTTGLWRWSFTSEDLKEYDEVYKKFWGQMIRWLVDESDFLPGQDISFKTDKYTYNLGDRVKFLVHTKHVDLAKYKPRIELTSAEGKRVNLIPTGGEKDQPGLYVAYFTPDSEGEFKAVLYNNEGEPKQDTARFTMYSDSLEDRFVAANSDLMGQIARATGGEEISLYRLKDLPRKVREFELASRERVKPEDVWDRFPIFLILIGLLSVEWFLRRRAGLV